MPDNPSKLPAASPAPDDNLPAVSAPGAQPPATRDPASSPLTGALSGTARLRARLGEREPVGILSSTADALDGLTLGVPVEIMRARPFKGKWTSNEILGHLVDCELVFGTRIRLILCEESPAITPFDQDRWVAIQAHNDVTPADHMMRFRALRTMNLAFWRALPAEGLRKFGVHSERGPETLELIRSYIAGHDLVHLDQLSRHLEAARVLVKG